MVELFSGKSQDYQYDWGMVDNGGRNAFTYFKRKQLSFLKKRIVIILSFFAKDCTTKSFKANTEDHHM